jgi:hypothetical protein
MNMSGGPFETAPLRLFLTHHKGEAMSANGPTRLSPASPLGYAELLVRNRIGQARQRVINGPRDRGASVVEWVIISAIVVGIAVAIGTALSSKLTSAVDNLDVTGGGGGKGGGGGGKP